MTNSLMLSRRMLIGAAASIGLFRSAPGFAGDYGAATSSIHTTNGPVRGRFEAAGVQVFKGLRYAAPPVGPLRFRAPQPLANWTDVFDAKDFGTVPIQVAGQRDAPFDEKQSEDCLFLNIWTKSLDDKKPVMVWLHGGAFSSGASSRPTYWGDHFARDGVVLVSVNHRLNIFGYTQLPESWGPEYASSGLAGMLDIIAALEWVKANIAQFGGDPDNVTVFGESGGGAKVSLLLGMPRAKGLYHKAIIQSGAALDATSRTYAQALGGAVVDALGIKPGDVRALAGVDASKIFACQHAAAQRAAHLERKGFLDGGGFNPSIDGRELPRGAFSPEAAAMAAQIPLIIGTNKDEGTLFAAGNRALATMSDADFEAEVRKAYPLQANKLIPALRASYPGYRPGELVTAMNGNRMFWVDTITLAERKLKQPAPVWMYRMDWESPTMGGLLKAGHAVELSLVFKTFENVRDFVGPGDAPAQMARQMHSAWVAFAKTGAPQTPTIPTWPKYDLADRSTMIFNLESHVDRDPHKELRKLMQGGSRLQSG